MNERNTDVRVAVDIGGTFTDLHLHDSRTGQTFVWKTPSTPADPSIGLLEGLHGITRTAGIPLSDIGMILHGSTIATNAVLERKLPKGALITTDGFRDVLEIGRHMRKDVYTLKAETRPLLIPRHLRFGVSERVKSDGSVSTPLNEQQVLTIIDQLQRENVETVAVVFLHGYRNPVHEQRVQHLIQQHAPGITVATSFDSSPEIREFERSSTTVLNALLQPVISNYLKRVNTSLQQAGVTAGLYLVQSNGGLATPEDAARLPARLLLSGPAGGATAMSILATRHKENNLVGFDVGGTSSDISVVSDGAIGETQESSIDGLPVRLPMVEIRTIGAGGGSIARVETNSLRVGPQSAGADPGPVCYNRGGKDITVTDANALLGLIDAKSFRTGGITLNVNASQTQLEKNIATPLALTNHSAANGVLEVANSHMADAIRLSLFEKGADPADFALAPFGGAAGLHACAVASELGMHRIIFPAHASTLSALGILQANLRHDLSIASLLPAHTDSAAELAAAVKKLHKECEEKFQSNGLSTSQCAIEFSCDMRYRGQAFELTTPWPGIESAANVNKAALNGLIEHFHHIHEQRFAFTAKDDPIEIVTVRAQAIGRLGNTLKQSTADPATKTSTDKPRTRTLSGNDGKPVEIPCVTRDAFIADQKSRSGPFIIEEEYTVLLIADHWTAKPLTGNDILCTRSST